MSFDLLVNEGDFLLNDYDEPDIVAGVDCVEQDIKHMLIERGFLTVLIGERDKTTISMIATNIENAIEDDERVLAGTASVSITNGLVMCTAETIDGDVLYFEVVSNG